MAKEKLFLWEISAVVTGDQPEPWRLWKLENGHADVDDEEIYSSTFRIIAPDENSALVALKIKTAYLPRVIFRPAVCRFIDIVVSEVTDLTGLLKD